MKGLIRAAGLADLDIILELEHLCFGSEAFDRRQYRYLLKHPRGRTLLYEEEGRLTAMIVLAWREVPSWLRIHSLAVIPQSRGRGIAALLLREAREWALELQRQWIVLEVRVDNLPAVNLYRKHGFREISRLQDYYGAGEDGFRMALPMLEAQDS